MNTHLGAGVVIAATIVAAGFWPADAAANTLRLLVEVPVDSPSQEVKAATFDPVLGKMMTIHRDDDCDGMVRFVLENPVPLTGGDWIWKGKAHLSLILATLAPPPVGTSAIVPIFEDSGLTIFTEVDDSIFRNAPPPLAKGQTLDAQDGSIAVWPDAAILSDANVDLDALVPPARGVLPGYTGQVRVAELIRLEIVPEPPAAALAACALWGTLLRPRRRRVRDWFHL